MKASSSSSRASPAPGNEAGTAASYEAVSFPFTIQSPSPGIASVVDFIYGEMRTQAAPPGSYPIEIRPAQSNPRRLELLLGGTRRTESERLGDILHQLDNELTIQIEQAVPRFYFVHAAALAEGSRATLLVGDSGAGKSTTSYALASSGMDYLSDELSPIDPQSAAVHPYPRAICLKREPPAPLILPSRHLRTEWTVHVRPRDLGSRVLTTAVPLARVVFVRYSPGHGAALLRPISKGEAAVRLYKGALNQLARPSFGLDDTLSLIRRAECYELLAAGVEETVQALRQPAPERK
jgi:hypothetical protein